MGKKLIAAILTMALLPAVLNLSIKPVEAKYGYQSSSEAGNLADDIGIIKSIGGNYLAFVMHCEVIVFTVSFTFMRISDRKKQQRISAE